MERIARQFEKRLFLIRFIQVDKPKFFWSLFLIQWFSVVLLLGVFSVFIAFKVDGLISWPWGAVFLPLWMLDFVVVVTASVGLGRYFHLCGNSDRGVQLEYYFWTAIGTPMAVVSQVLVALELDGQYIGSFAAQMIPLFVFFGVLFCCSWCCCSKHKVQTIGNMVFGLYGIWVLVFLVLQLDYDVAWTWHVTLLPVVYVPDIVAIIAIAIVVFLRLQNSPHNFKSNILWYLLVLFAFAFLIAFQLMLVITLDNVQYYSEYSLYVLDIPAMIIFCPLWVFGIVLILMTVTSCVIDFLYAKSVDSLKGAIFLGEKKRFLRQLLRETFTKKINALSQEFEEQYVNDFRKLLDRKDLKSDVAFVTADGRVIYAHRAILEMRADLFDIFGYLRQRKRKTRQLRRKRLALKRESISENSLLQSTSSLPVKKKKSHHHNKHEDCVMDILRLAQRSPVVQKLRFVKTEELPVAITLPSVQITDEEGHLTGALPSGEEKKKLDDDDEIDGNQRVKKQKKKKNKSSKEEKEKKDEDQLGRGESFPIDSQAGMAMTNEKKKTKKRKASKETKSEGEAEELRKTHVKRVHKKRKEKTKEKGKEKVTDGQTKKRARKDGTGWTENEDPTLDGTADDIPGMKTIRLEDDISYEDFMEFLLYLYCGDPACNPGFTRLSEHCKASVSVRNENYLSLLNRYLYERGYESESDDSELAYLSSSGPGSGSFKCNISSNITHHALSEHLARGFEAENGILSAYNTETKGRRDSKDSEDGDIETGEKEKEEGEEEEEEERGSKQLQHGRSMRFRKRGFHARSDIEFEVEGHCIKAHKCVLAGRCEYFEAMFKFREANQERIVIDDVPYTVFFAFLKAIYTGKTDVELLKIDDREEAKERRFSWRIRRRRTRRKGNDGEETEQRRKGEGRNRNNSTGVGGGGGGGEDGGEEEDKEELWEFIRVCNQYRFLAPLLACQEYLVDLVRPSNVLDLLLLSDLNYGYYLQPLRDYCLYYILIDFERIAKLKSFHHLSVPLRNEILAKRNNDFLFVKWHPQSQKVESGNLETEIRKWALSRGASYSSYVYSGPMELELS